MNLALLISGKLGLLTLHNLLNSKDFKVSFVFTDSGSSAIIQECERLQHPVYVGNPRNEKAAETIQKLSVDIILSVNYLFIIPNALISSAKYAINLHGSLLPKYRGRTPHVWSIINNETVTGVSAHFIDQECDTGDIIEQVKVPIEFEDTGADILRKFEDIYPQMVYSVLSKVKTGTVVRYSQDHSKATFFGKRTPEDGQINWNWQKERVRNWIRAQAKPYPGAFSFIGEMKVIIHKSCYDDLGFKDLHENGLILEANTDFLLVKTPNGVLRVADYICDDPSSIKPGLIFKCPV